MKISLPILFGATLLAWNTQANAAIISNLPDNVGGNGITSARLADPFTLGAPATVGSIRFWWSMNTARPLSDFSGTITYAFYQDSGGAVGSGLGSGTVAGLISTPTGNFASQGTCGAPNCPVQQVDFTLTSPISLAAGNFWLELHEGATVTANDATTTFWMTSAQTGGALTCTLPCASGFTLALSKQYAYELNAAETGVPEPATLALVGAGLACVLLRRRR